MRKVEMNELMMVDAGSNWLYLFENNIFGIKSDAVNLYFERVAAFRYKIVCYILPMGFKIDYDKGYVTNTINYFSPVGLIRTIIVAIGGLL